VIRDGFPIWESITNPARIVLSTRNDGNDETLNGLFHPFTWFVAPLALGLLSFALLPIARDREEVLTIGAFSLTGLAASATAVSYWSWVARDGLGPDSVTSHGINAAQRFLTDAGGPLLLLSCLSVVVVVCCARRFRRLPNEE
jgi:hypothetical protein